MSNSVMVVAEISANHGHDIEIVKRSIRKAKEIGCDAAKIQSYTPDNFALTTAAEHDYKSFFETEIRVRMFMDYPPFTDLILVEFTSDHEQTAMEAAERCRAYLLASPIENEADQIFAPKLSSHFKGKDSFRYYILIKCPKGQRNKYIHYIHGFGSELVKNKIDCNMTIDVNPYSTF